MANMNYTGERIIPDAPECLPGTLIYETHVARYHFALPFARGKTVLDLACGVGYGSRLLAENGALRVIGGDISRDAIAYARERFADRHTVYSVMSAADIPIPSSSVDLVVSFETVEHVPDGNRFLEEINRVLRVDGALIISTPNRDTYGTARDVPDNEFHTREYTITEFRNLLSRFFQRIELFSQRRLIRQSRLAALTDAMMRRLRFADKLGLRKILVPKGVRSLVGRATDAYDRDCRVSPLRADDSPLFFVAVGQRT